MLKRFQRIYQLSVLIGCLIVVVGLGGEYSDSSSGVTIGPRTTVWSIDQIRSQIVESNLNSSQLHSNGRLVRWRVPIAVNTNHIARADEAIERFQRLADGLISFQKTEEIPVNGIIFVEGGSEGPSAPSCGNVNNSPNPSSYITYSRDSSGALRGRYYIHLGSTACNDVTTGNYSSAIAEHELAHALGLDAHFDGFQGNEGLRHPNMFAVIYNIYNNPLGTRVNKLNITVVPVPKDFYRVPSVDERGAELKPAVFKAGQPTLVTLVLYETNEWFVKDNRVRLYIQLLSSFTGDPLSLLPDVSNRFTIPLSVVTFKNVTGFIPVSRVGDHWEGTFTLVPDLAIDRIAIGAPDNRTEISLPFVIKGS